MKEYEKRNLEVESNSDFESIDMSIDQKSMGFVFDIMFSQMYRDPIGSIIREITSNCFDSHIEAGVNDAVVITIDEDDGGGFISFKDVGIGISPDRMRSVYAKPATSTKRDSNDFIGYWGLGSKSPLAYVEEGFEVITVSEGMKYEYMVHKGTSAPQITLITSEETTEHNGTIVKIYFKRNSDKAEFDKKLESQLRYFDNVYVIGSNHFNNEYKLYEGNTFKFRNDCARVDLHICIGKVTYPIDWEKLGEQRITLPFALKFNIGDLPVTPERESIKYTSIKRENDEYVDTRDVIKAKIQEFKEEIQDMIGREPIYHNNIFDFIEAQGHAPYIKLLDRVINIPGQVADPPEQLYQPLESVGLKTPVNIFFNHYMIKRHLDTWSGSKMRNYDSLVYLSWRNFNDSLIVREFNAVGKFKQMKLDYLRKIAREENKQRIMFITHNTSKGERLYKYLDLPKTKRLDYTEWNKVKLYKYFKEVVTKEVILNSIDYDTLEIPKEFEEEWKLTNLTKRGTVEAAEGEILVDDFGIDTKSNRRVTLEIESLNEYMFVIYGFEKDVELLEKYQILFWHGKYADNCKVLKIRQRDEKDIVLLKNVIKVTAFMSNNPIFKSIATAAYIRSSKIDDYKFYPAETKEYSIDRTEIYTLLFAPMAEKWKELISKSRDTVNLEDSTATTEDLVKEILELAKANNWLDEDVVKGVQKVENYFKGLELLNYVVPSTKAIPHIANFVKAVGKPVNREWEVLEPWQKELLQELSDKFEYNSELNDVVSASPHHYNTPRRITTRREALARWTNSLRGHYKQIRIFNTYHNERSTIETN